MPDAVTLSQRIGIGGLLWPSSCRRICRNFPSLAFRNRSSSSDSTAYVTTNFNILQNKYTYPFILVGFTLLGFYPSIEYPATRLWDLVSDR